MSAYAREVAEELGGASKHIRRVAIFYPMNGITNGCAQDYLATEVEEGRVQRGPTELLRVVAIHRDEALRMARAGEITDGQSALAILLCEPYLRAEP